MIKSKISKVAVFLDGTPGHEKQTLGIVEQLKKKTDIEIYNYQLEKPTLTAQSIIWLNYLFGFPQKKDTTLADVDVAIGTGTHTHLPMLLAKKSYNFKVVTCMTPSTLLLNKFDLVFAPVHDNVTSHENVIRTIGPPNTNVNKGLHQENKVLILIGGVDPKSHVWNSQEIIESLELLISRDTQKQFVISSSPRTPDETEDKLSELPQKYKNTKFYRFKETAGGWVEQEYSRCRFVWVTGDSISMVYEALSSGCKVGIIPVLWKSKNSKFSRSVKFLQEKQLTVGLESYLKGEIHWNNNDSLNEAERCAEEILRRWG